MRNKSFINLLLCALVITPCLNSCGIIKVDMSGVSFNDMSYVYDGGEKILLITGELPEGVTVSYTENTLTNVGKIDVTASFEGKWYHKDIPSMTATLEITPATYDMSGISFNSASYIYDGQEKEIKITGTLPEGVTVSYSNNKLTNAGETIATATFSGSSNYKAINSMTAKLTIEKAVYNMAGISFESKTFVYDGKQKSVTISGTLPEGVSVRYENNTLTNAGTTVATAHFIGSSNYEDIPSMEATLTIEKATYDLSNIKFEDKTVIYNGESQKIEITGTLPNGVKVYYLNNELTDVGEVNAIAYFSGDSRNYNPIPNMYAVFTVAKATYDMSGIKFEDKVYKYTGETRKLEIEGTLPEGVTVSYKNNTLVNIGTVEATASFIGNANYNDIPDMKANLTIEYNTYDMSGISFKDASYVYDGTYKTLTIEGTLPEGVTVSYTNNTLKDVGELEVTASFTGGYGYYPIPDKKAKLTITTKYINLGKLFEDTTYNYDGTSKTISVDESLIPENCIVSYSDRNLTVPGSKEVTATVTCDDPNCCVVNGVQTANITVDKYSFGNYSGLYPIEIKAKQNKMEITVDRLTSDSNSEASLIWMKSFEYYSTDPEKGYSDYTTVSSGTKIGTYNLGEKEVFTIDRYSNNYDLLYCKFYVVQDENILAGPYYAVDIAEQDDYGGSLKPAGKKGLHITPDEIDYAIELGVKNISMNMVINSYMLADKTGYSDDQVIEFVSNGKTYYYNKAYFKTLDHAISLATMNDIAVTLIMYFQPQGSDTASIDNILKYPSVGTSVIYAVNCAQETPSDYYISFMEFVSSRYSRSDKRNGLVSSYVIGNEVDREAEWNLMCNHKYNYLSTKDYAHEYERTLRLANSAVKKYCSNATVHVPLTYYWSLGSGSGDIRQGCYPPKDFVDELSTLSSKQGNFNWGLAPHPYSLGMFNTPNVPKTDTLISAQNSITFDPNTAYNYSYINFELLDEYFHQDKLKCHGLIRNFVVNESGVSCNKSSEQDEQALSISYIYYKMCMLDCVSVWNYGAVKDEDCSRFKFGLVDSDQSNTRRKSYEVYKHLDKSDSFDYSNQYLSYGAYYDKSTSSYVSCTTSYKDLICAVSPQYNFNSKWNTDLFKCEDRTLLNKHSVHIFDGENLIYTGTVSDKTVINQLISRLPDKDDKKFAGFVDQYGCNYTMLSSIDYDVVLVTKYESDYSNCNFVILGSTFSVGSDWSTNESLENLYFNEWYASMGWSASFARVLAENYTDCYVANMSIQNSSPANISNVYSYMQQYNAYKSLNKGNGDVFIIEVGCLELNWYLQNKANLNDTLEGLAELVNTILSDNPNAQIVLMNSPQFYNPYTYDTFNIYAEMLTNGLEGFAKEYGIVFYDSWHDSGVLGSNNADDFDFTYFYENGSMNENGYRNLIYNQLMDALLTGKSDYDFNVDNNILVLGDSITAGAGDSKLVDADNYWTYEWYKTYYGEEGFSGGYSYLLAEEYENCYVYNMAVGGATVSIPNSQWAGDNNFANQYATFERLFGEEDIDLIIVNCSSNDLNYYQTGTAWTGDLNSTDLTSSIGALKALIDELKEKYPNATIIITNFPDRYFGVQYDYFSVLNQYYLQQVELYAQSEGFYFVDFYNDSGLVACVGNPHDCFVDFTMYQEGIHIWSNAYEKCEYPLILAAYMNFVISSVNL